MPEGTEWSLEMVTLVTAVTATFSNALAAIIVILAILGVYGLVHMKGSWRSVALVLILGILMVNIGFLHNLGVGLRNGLTDFAARQGHPEVSGTLTFTLLLIVAFALAAFIGSRSRSDVWKWLMILIGALFFTMGWASDVIVWISAEAAKFLGWIQQVNF